MQQYLDLVNHVLTNGLWREDRTGVGTIGVFGYQTRFDLSQGFPLVTTARKSPHRIITELLWMLSGDTNVRKLQEQGNHIWDAWADSNGNLGPVYGYQWRKWPQVQWIDDLHAGLNRIDQVANLIRMIRDDPYSRRHIISAWNVAELDRMALPPCHILVQFYVSNGGLSGQLYQRSADCMLGVPYNWASYALLTHMIAQVCDLEAREFIWSAGDVHIYLNHIEGAQKQVQRKPKALPKLKLNPAIKDIDSFTEADIEVMDYDAWPRIEYPIAV